MKVVVTADEKYHSPIIYPLAVVKRSKNVTRRTKEFTHNFYQVIRKVENLDRG
ncbi:hypothetical protein RI030_01310 [Aphanizomenon flos-aquae NRERC-008]|nr:hypothetical protein [Aphanizomenon flos-aquae NRERC-008]